MRPWKFGLKVCLSDQEMKLFNKFTKSWVKDYELHIKANYYIYNKSPLANIYIYLGTVVIGWRNYQKYEG